MQVIGLGAQNDLTAAQDFVATDLLSDGNVSFVWDPDFTTWDDYGVRINSTMLLLDDDYLTAIAEYRVFDDKVQDEIVALVAASS